MNRFVMLTGSITLKSVSHVMERMIELASESNKPIILIINSDGGDLPHALALHDFIRSIGPKVIGLTVGWTYSSAGVVLQACHSRYVTPSSTYMLHTGVSSSEDNASFLSAKRNLQADRLFDNAFLEIVSRRTGVTLKELKRLERRITYLTADDCIKRNFADGILTGSIWGLSNFKKKK